MNYGKWSNSKLEVTLTKIVFILVYLLSIFVAGLTLAVGAWGSFLIALIICLWFNITLIYRK
jgi:hypothetical protein